MVKKNVLMNMGMCMGVVNCDVFAPNPDVARLDICVKTDQKNPETNKFRMQVLNFVAYGDLAQQIVSSCKKGQVVMLFYRLDERMIINKENGVGNYVTELVITDITIRSEKHSGKICNRNEGLIEALFLGIEKIPTADGVYALDVAHKSRERNMTHHLRFFVYGELGKEIKSRYCKGQPVTVVYKVEKIKRQRENEKSVYFTNLVLERLF